MRSTVIGASRALPAGPGEWSAAATRVGVAPGQDRRRRLVGAVALVREARDRRRQRFDERLAARLGTAPASSSLRSCRTRVPRSAVSSSRTCRSGMRLMRRRFPSSWRTNGIARPSAATVASRSAGWPMTLTQTLAWRRSGVVSTLVIVTNPIRGSATSRADDRRDLLAQQLVDPIGPLTHRTDGSANVAVSPDHRARLTVCDVKHSMMSPSSRSW